MQPLVLSADHLKLHLLISELGFLVTRRACQDGESKKVDEYVFEVSDKVNGNGDFLCSIVKTGFKEEEEI